VQWSGQPEALATWEDYDDLKRRFPQAPVWGQAGSQGRENVSIDTDADVWDPSAVVQREKRARQESTRYSSKDWVQK